MYQWLLILIVLLFFIYNFTNVNKECFNVGANNIQISSQLFLTDVCSKKEDGASCTNDKDCQSNFCYPLKASYAQATCQTKSEGIVKNHKLCIDYNDEDNRLVDSINDYLNDNDFDTPDQKEKNINFFKKYFSKYNSSFICKPDLMPKDYNLDFSNLKIAYDSDNKSELHRICEEFYSIIPNSIKESVQGKKHILCNQTFNMSYCDSPI